MKISLAAIARDRRCVALKKLMLRGRDAALNGPQRRLSWLSAEERRARRNNIFL